MVTWLVVVLVVIAGLLGGLMRARIDSIVYETLILEVQLIRFVLIQVASKIWWLE